MTTFTLPVWFILLGMVVGDFAGLCIGYYLGCKIAKLPEQEGKDAKVS